MDCISCVDIGNQFLKFATFNSKGEILSEGNAPNSESSEIIQKLNSMGQTLVCDVANRFQDISALTSTKRLSLKYKFPFKIEYESPETLGLDRLCGLSGAMLRAPHAHHLLVFSLGTCLTIDFLGKEKIYLGGSISPGLKMRYNALNHYTANLPLLTYQEVDKINGHNTFEAIHCGVQNGIVAELEFYMNHFKNKVEDLTVFLSGGDVECFVNKTKSKIFAAPNLNLYGLFNIAKINDLI
jgi:type III pantothenate kinase